MLLADVLEYPNRCLVYLERYCNDGSPSGMTFGRHQVSKKYRPLEGEPTFELPSYLVPWERCEVITGRPSGALARSVLLNDGVVFHAHPDMEPLDLPTLDQAVSAQPLASGRTVYVGDAPARQIKLHYGGMIGRVPRELPRHRVVASVSVSSELDALSASLPSCAAFLPESIGVSLGSDVGDIGMVIREQTPRPWMTGGVALVPAFALFSTDRNSPSDAPLLEQILNKFSNPIEGFVEHVLSPILESYAALAFGLGIVPEDHGQNLLLELDGRGQPRRAIRRDFLDAYADLEIRRARGHAARLPRAYDVRTDGRRAYGGRSYAFDFRLGEYILDPTIELVVRCFGASSEWLRKWVVERVGELAFQYDVRLDQYFQPWDAVYRYARSTNIWADGEPNFEVTSGPRYR